MASMQVFPHCAPKTQNVSYSGTLGYDSFIRPLPGAGEVAAGHRAGMAGCFPQHPALLLFRIDLSDPVENTPLELRVGNSPRLLTIARFLGVPNLPKIFRRSAWRAFWRMALCSSSNLCASARGGFRVPYTATAFRFLEPMDCARAPAAGRSFPADDGGKADGTSRPPGRCRRSGSDRPPALSGSPPGIHPYSSPEVGSRAQLGFPFMDPQVGGLLGPSFDHQPVPTGKAEVRSEKSSGQAHQDRPGKRGASHRRVLHAPGSPRSDQGAGQHQKFIFRARGSVAGLSSSKRILHPKPLPPRNFRSGIDRSPLFEFYSPVRFTRRRGEA